MQLCADRLRCVCDYNRRSQSYGYEPGPGGKLVGQAPPSDIYSGLRNDTVGPAFYNPTVKRAVKVRLFRQRGCCCCCCCHLTGVNARPNHVPQLADFSKRSRDREVFRPTDNPVCHSTQPPTHPAAAAVTISLMLHNNPLVCLMLPQGPGHYNPGTPGELAEGSTQQPRRGPLAKGRLQRSTQTAPSSVVRRKPQQSAVFKSKTPMAHEMKVKSNGEPGPGSYTRKKKEPIASHLAHDVRQAHPFLTMFQTPCPVQLPSMGAACHTLRRALGAPLTVSAGHATPTCPTLTLTALLRRGQAPTVAAAAPRSMPSALRLPPCLRMDPASPLLPQMEDIACALFQSPASRYDHTQAAAAALLL